MLNYGEMMGKEIAMITNIVVFDTKKEALKFINKISFTAYDQYVEFYKKDRKWVVSYRTDGGNKKWIIKKHLNY